MFGRNKRIEKRKKTYENLADDFIKKMERVEDKDLIDLLGSVYDALNAQAITADSLDSRKDKKVKQRLSKILMINDSTFVDVKERFGKDCQEVVNLLAGGSSAGYTLTRKEKKAREQRLEGVQRQEDLQEALENVEKYSGEIKSIYEQIADCLKRVQKEKDDSKAVLILREKKSLEMQLKQKTALREQNNRIIMISNNEQYVNELKTINKKFDLERMAKTAREMERLQQEQRLNDRLFEEIQAMTDKSMGISTNVSQAELDELAALRKVAVKDQQERVFDKADEVLQEIEQEYEDQLEVEELL